MRFVFINRFYWPETPATGQLLTDLAAGFATRGHEVNVITSAANATTPCAETHRSVRIHRVRGTRWSRSGIAGKAIDFATFYLGAMRHTLRLARRDTLVVAMTDPPLLGIGAWLVARLRGARVVHWVQDIYPEIAMELGGQRWLRVLRPLRNCAWRRADGCVSLGHDMACVLSRAGVVPENISVIPNWALSGTTTPDEITTAALRREWQLEGKFTIAYSGNLGRVHDLEPVLAVADALRAEKRIAFVLIGDGAQRAALEATAAQRTLPNMIFKPVQPRSRLAESLALPDLHLVTLRPNCENLVFPSKLYGVAASGRPILFIGPPECEVARIVAEHDLGLAAERGDTSRIVSFIRKLGHDHTACARHAAAARRFAAQHTLDRAIDQWSAVLAKVAASEPRAARVNPRAA